MSGSSRTVLRVTRPLVVMMVAALLAGHAHAAPLHYDLNADIRLEAGEVAVDVTISLPRVGRGDEASFSLGSAFRITGFHAPGAERVRIGPTNKPWGGLQGISIRYAKAVQRPKVRIVYAGKPNTGGEPPMNLVGPGLVELNLDGMWLPIQSELSGRFSVDARLAGLPEGYVFMSQGRSRRERGSVRVERAVQDVDFAFVAAPGFKRVKLSGFDLHTAQPDSARAVIFSRHGEGALEYLSKLLGPTPGRPQLVLVSRPRKSGYARRGYVVVVDDGQRANEAPLAGFIAHEFAHLWFGNANATTQHRWIDESISEYLALRYVEHSKGPAERDAMVERKRSLAARAGTILRPEAGTPALYSKGPLILLELERRIGRSTLDKILATAAGRKTTTTEEFLGIVATQSSQAQAGWLEAALLAEGPHI